MSPPHGGTVTASYVEIPESAVPADVRFHVPRDCAGQHVEIAYGGWGRYEHGPGDPYKRVHDRSIGPGAIRYYRMVAHE